jgi:hypothetical protein
MGINSFRSEAMYDHIKTGLEKIERDARFFRDMWKMGFQGQPLGFVLPPHAAEAVATCYIINAVSIFGEALKLVLKDRFAPTHDNLYNLKNMIDYAGQMNSSLDVGALQNLRVTRNDLAHEMGQYRNWPELDNTLQLIRMELGKLGAL